MGCRCRLVPLARNKVAVLNDRVPAQAPHPRKELVARILERQCELCGRPDKVVVHQVRALASLGKLGPGQPESAALMARKRRKTLIVCQPCHEVVHGHADADTA